MLLYEKMKTYKFSQNEKMIIAYILKERYNIRNKTTKEIASETYTSPSLLIRIAKKLGYDGWQSLKVEFLKECEYLDRDFTRHVDANIPFTKQDDIKTIANNLSLLGQKTIEDTNTLLNFDTLQTAIHLLDNATDIKVFAIGRNQYVALNFISKMNHLGKNVALGNLSSEQDHAITDCRNHSCFVVISYTGTYLFEEELLPYLKQKHIKILAITSLGVTPISSMADCILHLTTREKKYSKISDFSISTSLTYLLDVLYAGVYSLHYDEYYQKHLEYAHRFDHRFVSNSIIKEEK